MKKKETQRKKKIKIIKVTPINLGLKRERKMNKHKINLTITTDLSKEEIFEGLKRLCKEQFIEVKMNLEGSDLEYIQERKE